MEFYIYFLKYTTYLQEGLTEDQLEAIMLLPKNEICQYMIVRNYLLNFQAFHIFPGVFYQVNIAIELQDLPGNIYYLENWFTQDNLLEYAKEQLSELGEFDIAVDSQDSSEEIMMVSENNVDTIKCHLFQNLEGPQGMIVYQ